MGFSNRSQPPEGAAFDFGSQFAEDIVCYFAPLSTGRNLRNWAGKEDPQFFPPSNAVTTLGYTTDRIGIQWSGSNNDNNYDIGAIPTNYGGSSGKPFTIFVVHNRPVSNSNVSLYRRHSSGANPTCDLYIGSNTNLNRLSLACNFDATVVTGNYVYPVSGSQFFASAAVHDAAAEIRLYTDGSLDAIGTDSQTWTLTGTSGNHTIGSPNGGSGAQGSTIVCAAWNRALSADEIRELSLNPWAPLKRFSYLKVFIPSTPPPPSIVANPMGGLSPLLGYVL